jgi:signal transduction histidine kinase
MRKRVEENIREARQSIWNLRSPTLERRDLASALREFGQQAAAAAGVSFSLEVTGAPQQRLPKVEAEVLRIAQEAVTNALRHARASHVKVEMQYGEGALTLRVSDDGCGFDPVRIDAARHEDYRRGARGAPFRRIRPCKLLRSACCVSTTTELCARGSL